jgi:acyl-CoA synthetase (AMP-forming)/AMP-acid ligase II
MIELYQNPILEAIYARAREGEYRQKIAVQEARGQAISYADFVAAIEAVAIHLVERGFAKGDRAVLLLRPSIDLMIVALAIVRAGGVLVIADPAMGKTVFEERIRMAEAKWLFAESIFLLLEKLSFLRPFLKRRGLEIPELQSIAIREIVNVGAIPFLGKHSLETMKRKVSRPIVEISRDERDDITIVFTSGTTGNPKGVVHTLASMLATIGRIHEYLSMSDRDVIYDTGILLLLPALMRGAATVLGVGKFSPEKTLEAYRHYGVTKTIDVPAHLQQIVKYLEAVGQKLPETLEDYMLGAAPVLPDFLRKLPAFASPKTRFLSVYGMTELLPAAFVTIDEKLCSDTAMGDLIGHPMRGIAARLAEDGELLLSGDGLFDRYLGDSPLKEHPTGDLARMDEDGRLYLLGRKKDMIIRGHYNIYPPLYEATISQIQGVEAAAMVGVYNAEKADEDVILFIESQETNLEALKKRIQAELLSGEHSIDVYAQPDFIFFQKLPYSGRSLKLDKKALRVMAQAFVQQKALP